MNFFVRRRCRKLTEHLLHEAKHVRNMREDVAPGPALAKLQAAEEALQRAWDRRDEHAVDAAAEGLSDCLSSIYPAKSHPWIRENLEILVVALAVAMAFRTYIIQPFKIPTGSMQPTLYGITVRPQTEPALMDRFPLNLFRFIVLGEYYSVVKAKVSGTVDSRYAMDEDSLIFYINGIPHKVTRGLSLYFSPGDQVTQGQVLASGEVKLGDHIFVDKLRYNFGRPKRGDIIVFSTAGIRYPRIKTDTFYIKRLAALPGEEVSIVPPYLVINDQEITEPYPFQRLLTEKEKGYIGYTVARPQAGEPAFLQNPGEKRILGDGQFLPLGDNTAYSLDGRYFGPIDKESLVGPAFMVYWPFTKRWGRAR